MSYEYVAAVRLTEAEVARLMASLPEGDYVVVSKPAPTRLLLRFGRRPARERWPEDIDVRFEETVYVAIHAGTGAERTGFLRHLESRLRELGRECAFEEL